MAKAKGKTLSDEDMKEYHTLCVLIFCASVRLALTPRHSSRTQSNVKAVSERQAVATLSHEQKVLRDGLAAAQDSLEVAERKVEKLQTDEASLLERKATVRRLLTSKPVHELNFLLDRSRPRSRSCKRVSAARRRSTRSSDRKSVV